jgi:hypothetical protein
MSKKTARHRFDPSNPPPLTKAQKAELAALEAAPDSDIDYSEIPVLTEKFWKNAVRNPYYRPIKSR